MSRCSDTPADKRDPAKQHAPTREDALAKQHAPMSERDALRSSPRRASTRYP